MAPKDIKTGKVIKKTGTVTKKTSKKDQPQKG